MNKFKVGDKIIRKARVYTIKEVTKKGYLLDRYTSFDTFEWIESEFELYIVGILKNL